MADGQFIILCMNCGRRYRAVYDWNEPLDYRWEPARDTAHFGILNQCPPCRDMSQEKVRALVKEMTK